MVAFVRRRGYAACSLRYSATPFRACPVRLDENHRSWRFCDGPTRGVTRGRTLDHFRASVRCSLRLVRVVLLSGRAVRLLTIRPIAPLGSRPFQLTLDALLHRSPDTLRCRANCVTSSYRSGDHPY